MRRQFVAYTTYDGHTAKIAERIARHGLCGRRVRSGTHAAGATGPPTEHRLGIRFAYDGAGTQASRKIR